MRARDPRLPARNRLTCCFAPQLKLSRPHQSAMARAVPRSRRARQALHLRPLAQLRAVRSIGRNATLGDCFHSARTCSRRPRRGLVSVRAVRYGPAATIHTASARHHRQRPGPPRCSSFSSRSRILARPSIIAGSRRSSLRCVSEQSRRSPPCKHGCGPASPAFTPGAAAPGSASPPPRIPSMCSCTHTCAASPSSPRALREPHSCGTPGIGGATHCQHQRDR